MRTEHFVLDQPGEHKVYIPFETEGEEVEVVGLVRAVQAGEYNVDVVVDHIKGKSFGRVSVKAIAKNGARVKLSGMIKIREGANGVDDFLELRCLILDDKSTATAEPKLEIEANEVKASHAATVSKIDEEQLFYLSSRGIQRVESEEMIVNGFLESK